MADYLKVAPVTQNLANSGLVAGTTSTLTMPAATVAVIDGKFGTARAIISANTAFGTAVTNALDANTGVALAPIVGNSTTGSAACVVFGVTSAGLLRVVLGPQTPCDLGVTTTPGAFRLAPQFPAIPDDFCPIAYTIARTSPSVPSVVVGTASWANNFTTFQNISTLPDKPQIA